VSRYAVQWFGSKGDVVDIDDREAMNDFRLVASTNKHRKKLDDIGDPELCSTEDKLLMSALELECDARGLDPRFKGGRAPVEQPQEEGFA